jgi:hypothetical protein
MSSYVSERAETDETVREDLTACTAGGRLGQTFIKAYISCHFRCENTRNFYIIHIKRIKNINFKITIDKLLRLLYTDYAGAEVLLPARITE